MTSRKKVFVDALRIAEDDACFERVVVKNASFFADCQTVLQQVSVLQKILKDTKHEDILEFLCVLYLAAGTAETASLRRASFGALRKIPAEKVAPVMWSRLSYLMSKDPEPMACVDELSVLCAWQPHGVQTLEANRSEVLQYLVRAMEATKSTSHESSESWAQCLNKASKVVRCSAVLRRKTHGSLRESFAKQAALIKEALLSDNKTLSCLLACGVSLPEILIVEAEGPQALYKAQVTDLLPNPLAHVCFIAGMINVTPLNTGNKEIHNFYGELLTDLDRLGTLEDFHKKPPFALTCSRTVVQWTEKLVDSSEVLSDLLDQRHETLLRIAFVNAEHYVDAVQHQGRALMEIVFDALAASPEKKYSEFLKTTFERLLTEPHHKKSKYAPLTIIAKHVGVSSFIHRAMIREMYDTLSEKSMLPYVQDFLRDVGRVHLDESPSDWQDVWLTPFFDVYVEGKAPIIENLIPLFVRLYKPLVDIVLDRCQYMPITPLALKLLPLEKLLDHKYMIDEAQWSTDEKMRQSLLHIITDCAKSCEPLNPEVIPHLKIFLTLNSSTQSQALRQAMFSSFKKLVHRMTESAIFWAKPGKTHEVYGERVQQVLRQQEEFVTWMFNFCVGELRPGCNFFTRSTVLMLLELLAPLVTAKWTSSKAATLVQCIKDTYESNKTAVLNILATIPRHLLPFTDDAAQWVQNCVALTRSARPPDCVTAAYMLRVIAASSDPANRFKITEQMSRELSRQISIATEQGLVEASSASPMYGALTCLRILLNDTLSTSIPNELLSDYRALFEKLVEQCKAVAKIATPLVTNASPEGQLQLDEHPELEEEFKKALFKGFGKNLENADTVKACAVASQMLLLCCWRSHKEVSLTFGELAAHLSQLIKQRILPKNEFVDMGTFFMDELCTVRHRGAFEQAYVGFSSLCGALWRTSDAELNKLPSAWLNELVGKIKDEAVSSTRRSAGLPFIVQAVVVTEPEVNGGQALRQAMEALLPLAESESSEVARVHALNVLRVLYKDTRLGETVIAFVSRGMMTALEGFDHPVWGVRNSCTLLFSALVTRIFGVNRSKQDVERKNCLTGNMFFLRFPELFEFLLNRMSYLLETKERQPGLFPILLLLGKLSQSLNDSKLLAFLDPLDCCANSHIISIRKAAATAFAILLPISSQERLPSLKLQRFIELNGANLPVDIVHGLLLQTQAVLSLPNCSEKVRKTIAEKLDASEYVLEQRCSVTAALYLELLMYLRVHKPSVMKLRSDEFSAEGRTYLEVVLTRFKCETGGIHSINIVTDHEKMGILEWLLSSETCPPELMTQIILNPWSEHPDVQKLAFDLAAKRLHEAAKDQLEHFVARIIEQLPAVTVPFVAVSMFTCIANHVRRLPVKAAVSTIGVLHRYSAANQDPDMRRVASDLARKLFEAHGRAVFEQSNSTGTYLTLCEALINLVVDNDVYVRNQITSGISSVTTENLKDSSPLDSLLALCTEMCDKKDELAKLLVNLALATEEAPLDVEFDEQPFEKGELNTFHDSLVIAESCRKAVSRMGVTQIEFDESQFESLKAKISSASACDLAFNRQLDADLVKLGQYYVALSMRKGQLATQDTCLVANDYFSRFSRTQ